MKIVKNFQLKIVIFTAVKYSCILHGNVFIMDALADLSLCWVYVPFCGFYHGIALINPTYTILMW